MLNTTQICMHAKNFVFRSCTMVAFLITFLMEGGSKENVTFDSERSCPPRLRFIVCLMLLISMGVLQIFLTIFILSSNQTVQIIAKFSTVFMSLFSLHWCQLYSSGLTRTKRAFFDEVNVLETYQPRARTMGHLFMPEPPTPAPDSVKGQEEAANSRNAFIQLRDAHYANEYEHCTKVNREINAMSNERKATDNEGRNPDEVSNPKIEGPILIEFHSEPDDDDKDGDEYFNM